MAHTNRKYIDSHWMIFIIRGVTAIIFGWLSLFSVGRDLSSLVSVIGVFLLAFSIIEFVNSLHRAHEKTGWTVSVSLAIIDAVVALALLFNIDNHETVHLIIIGLYTILRGLFEIISGFRTTVDPTDRFIWILSGVSGCIMGFAVLNSGELFIRFFGAYLFALGLCSLIYGVHNHAQKTEDKIARAESARLAAKTRAKNTRLKKSTPRRKK